VVKENKTTQNKGITTAHVKEDNILLSRKLLPRTLTHLFHQPPAGLGRSNPLQELEEISQCPPVCCSAWFTEGIWHKALTPRILNVTHKRHLPAFSLNSSDWKSSVSEVIKWSYCVSSGRKICSLTSDLILWCLSFLPWFIPSLTFSSAVKLPSFRHLSSQLMSNRLLACNFKKKKSVWPHSLIPLFFSLRTDFQNVSPPS